MKINWDKVSPKKFEELCWRLLEKNGFVNLKWIGKSGKDRCRDILAEKNIRLFPGKIKMTKCIIQCKRYIKNPPSITDLDRTISWAKGHNPDVLFFIISNTLTSDTKDWIEKLRKDQKFDIDYWEELDLKSEILKYKDIWYEFFGENKPYPGMNLFLSDFNKFFLEIKNSITKILKKEITHLQTIKGRKFNENDVDLERQNLFFRIYSKWFKYEDFENCYFENLQNKLDFLLPLFFQEINEKGFFHSENPFMFHIIDPIKIEIEIPAIVINGNWSWLFTIQIRHVRGEKNYEFSHLMNINTIINNADKRFLLPKL